MFRLINVIKSTDNDREQQAIYTHEDLPAAISDMHNRFGVALKDEKTQSVYCLVINDDGDRIDACSYRNTSSENESYRIKPRVFTIRTIDGAVETDIAAYDSMVLAKGNYHTKIASCMNNVNCSKAVVACLDDAANYEDFTNWVRES